MAVCYHCKEKKSGFTQFPSKYVGENICFACCEKLGLNYLLTTDESLNAHNKNYYKNFEQLEQILKERKPIYDKLASAFSKTKAYETLGAETIEIDEKSKIISIVKKNKRENTRIYFNYSDFIKIENIDNSKNFSPGQVAMSNFFIRYKYFGKETVIITDNKNTELFEFLSNIKK